MLRAHATDEQYAAQRERAIVLGAYLAVDLRNRLDPLQERLNLRPHGSIQGRDNTMDFLDGTTNLFLECPGGGKTNTSANQPRSDGLAREQQVVRLPMFAEKLRQLVHRHSSLHRPHRPGMP